MFVCLGFVIVPQIYIYKAVLQRAFNSYFVHMYGVRTHANVCGNPAHVEVGAALLPDQLFQHSLGDLVVVKEGRVRVYVRVDALVDLFALRVDLWVRTKGLQGCINQPCAEICFINSTRPTLQP